MPKPSAISVFAAATSLLVASVSSVQAQSAGTEETDATRRAVAAANTEIAEGFGIGIAQLIQL